MSETSRAPVKAAPVPKPDPKPAATLARGHVLQRKCACGGSAGLSGSCEGCDRGNLLQRRTAGGMPAAVPNIVHEVLRSPGRPLDAGTRPFMESRLGRGVSRQPVQGGGLQRALRVGAAGDFHEREADRVADGAMRGQADGRHDGAGVDFSHVRVHTDDHAAESARAHPLTRAQSCPWRFPGHRIGVAASLNHCA